MNRAKLTIKHITQLIFSLLQVVDDEYSFACCESVGLEYIGCVQLFEE